MQFNLTYSDLRRFWTSVDTRADNGCWDWHGDFTHDHGGTMRYPRFRAGNSEILARRLAYFLHFREVPKHISTTCRNQACVNPMHMLPRPELKAVCGSFMSSKNWKTTDEKMVRAVVTLHNLGRSQLQIARKLGIGASRVNMIIQMADFCARDKLRPYRNAS